MSWLINSWSSASSNSARFMAIISPTIRETVRHDWLRALASAALIAARPIHSQEELAELRLLLNSNAPARPDVRRPGFFEIEGANNVYYVFKYPTGTKVLLLAVWERDRVAELAAVACCSAA